MSKNTGIPYEVLTQQIFQALLDQTEVKNIRVEQNVTLKGKILDHQIDVYWEYELAGVIYRTVVQAKDWQQSVTQVQLLTFKGVLDDLPNQPRGIFVTRTGYQSGAKEFAEAHGIKLYELREPTAKDMEGRIMTICLTFSVLTRESSDAHYLVDQKWVDAECKKLGIPKPEPRTLTISGLNNKIFFFNEVGDRVGDFKNVIQQLFPPDLQDLVGVPATDKEHLFSEPTFMHTVNPDFPRIKVCGIRAKISVKQEDRGEHELKGEEIIGFILRDVIGGKTRLIDQHNRPINKRTFK